MEIREEGDTLWVNIFPRVPRWQEALLVGWLLAWTGCGVYFMTQLFGDHSRDLKLAIVVLLSFWVYYEYRITYILLWRKFGVERIRVDTEALLIKDEIKSYGKVRRHFLENVRDIALVEEKEKSWGFRMNDMFWDKEEGKLSFRYSGQEIRFGRQLETETARRLVKKIRHKVERNREHGEEG